MQQFLVLQDLGYVRHCKENAPIYMYALIALLRSNGNAYYVTSYRKFFRPRAPQYFWISLRQWIKCHKNEITCQKNEKTTSENENVIS